MKEVDVIDQVRSFAFSNGHLAWLTKDKNLLVDHRKQAENIEDFKLWKDQIILQQATGLTMGPLVDFSPACALEGSFSLVLFQQTETAFFLTKSDNGASSFWSGSDNCVIRKIPSPAAMLKAVSSDILLAHRMTVLSGHNPSDGSTLWEVDYKQLLQAGSAQQVGRIVFYKNGIYVCLKENALSDRVVTFGIDKGTGAVLCRLEGFGGNMSLVGDKIYAVGRSFELLELDPDSREIKTYDFSRILDPKNLKLNWGKWQVNPDGLFYFIDGMRRKNRFGIIDLHKEELLEVVEIKINDGINDNIVDLEQHEGRIYVHTSDDRLHIFERD